MDSIYAASPAVALLVAVLIQVAKNSPRLAWISRDTERLNTYVSVALATLSGLGLAVAFDWDQETGRFALGFHGNAYDMLHLVLHAPLQWAQQHGIYKLCISLPEAAGETRAIQRDILSALQGRVANLKPPPRTDVHGNEMHE